MSKHDRLGRATWGHIDPHPVSTTTDRENQWLKFLNVHGCVNSHYLHELTRFERKCYYTANDQMRKLRAGKLIEYPLAQRQSTFAPWNNFYVYKLTAQGKAWLDLPDAVRPSGHWLHAYMTSCVTASIDIMARRDSCRYIPAHEILDRSGASLGVEINGRQLIPDQLFAIDYGGEYRAFAVEVDRGTEPKTASGARKSYENSIRQYIEFIGGKVFKKHYGLKTNMLALFVFANESDQAGFLELLASFGSPGYVLTQTVSNFDTRYGKPYHPPKLFDHLWRDPWKTANGWFAMNRN